MVALLMVSHADGHGFAVDTGKKGPSLHVWQADNDDENQEALITLTKDETLALISALSTALRTGRR